LVGVDAEQWDEKYAANELVWGAEPNRFVRAQCERLPVGRAVDLACGEGRNALWLARLGWKATGVDFSNVAIERARRLTTREAPAVAGRLTWRVGDVTAEPIKRGGYDLALISYLHLAPEANAAVIRNAGYAVAPGGHLVIVGHDRRNLSEGVGGPPDAARLYDGDEIRAVLADVPSLVVELAEVVKRETPDGVALDTLVRARRPAAA
jgi:SAM-dependent methyltransferase